MPNVTATVFRDRIRTRPPAKTFLEKVKKARDQAVDALLALQHPEGYWWAELESNVTITAEYLMMHRFLGLPGDKFPALVREILSQQLDNGGWSLWYEDGGDLSTSVEAYQALKMAGLSAADPRLVKARQFILERGGALASRVFTRINLALFGQVSWDGIPLLPVEFMLLPVWSGFSIYEFSSWSRATMIPLSIVMAHRPVYPLPPSQGVAEIFAHPDDPFKHHQVAWKKQGPALENFFVLVDRLLKLYARLPWALLRHLAMHKAERWILDHQEETGDWGGIQPAMVNSLLALACQGYKVSHPVIQRGLAALEAFTLKLGDRLRLQSCISPVWDTGLAVRALAAAGLRPGHPALEKATAWLLANQIFKPGDWSVKRPHLAPGGWAFEFDNNWYPDIDDSAVVLMALKEALTDPSPHQTALATGIAWCLGMQSKNGGFAAFDVDNTKDWLNAIPFSDLKALIDPPTEDVTGRVLEMMGTFGFPKSHPAAVRALAIIRKWQQPDGCWWGRWGVNYLYGTWSVLLGLKAIGISSRSPMVRRAATWLSKCQNQDGGWGECCESYRDPTLRGQGPSTASQTAWAVMGLMAAGETASPAVKAGIDYLVKTQQKDGRWQEQYFTGTGFPSHFMIRYHLYRDVFPLMALGMYLREFAGDTLQ
jgi:squalene-hopene/tetraprenyl-beta-curcumene cyclase|uniref:Squalene--hopene cyclase n=1 Tax=Desulfobacca acetoxidans TaxID=60893 RepID=A0A7V6DPM1_9BACT